MSTASTGSTSGRRSIAGEAVAAIGSGLAEQEDREVRTARGLGEDVIHHLQIIRLANGRPGSRRSCAGDAMIEAARPAGATPLLFLTIVGDGRFVLSLPGGPPEGSD
jgi:hypothetical protein